MPGAMRRSVRAVPALVAVLLLAGCAAPGCRNTLARRIPSPDRQNDAVVFRRECGAAEGASSGVAIIPHDADLPDMPTSVLTLAQPVDVAASWTSPTELRLAFPASARVVGAMTSSPEGVAIRLQPR